MKTLFWIPIPVLFLSIAVAAEDPTRCESAKEFITTFEFLRDTPDMAASGDNALKIASKVAEGCTGAAKRFIETAQFLKKSDFPLQEVFATAIEFAQRENIHVEAFNQIFKRAYAEDGFDLDVATSLALAKAVSIEYSGNIKRALQDFEKMSDYCLNENELTIGKADCAQLSKRISLSAKEKGPTASEVFISSYRFLKGSVGIAAHEALKISEELIKIDPKAFENFKTSYEYALSDKGLRANKEQAIQLGRKLAAFSIKETKNSSAK